ncbi:Glycogenin-1 [Smittium culicis]|uniref:glycogenin glucosyltransferase n=1 Tax=Smittium culicis TaxID=133412 RepID=A0A1R1XKL9_9FUNG|nr:Glycogenin-1 [Smittium culicis]
MNNLNAAYATLVTNDSYVNAALVLAHSIRSTDTKYKLLCLATESNISPSNLSRLKNSFDSLINVNTLTSNNTQGLQLLERPDLADTYTKIQLWNPDLFPNCDSICYLDSDILVLQNLDTIFQRYYIYSQDLDSCNPKMHGLISAAPDMGWPDCFNSGVMLIHPNTSTFSDLVNLVTNDQNLINSNSNGLSFDGADQGLLNHYFSDWSSSPANYRLSFTFNVTGSQFYSYTPAIIYNQSKIKLVHFAGQKKPWTYSRFSDGSVFSTQSSSPYWSGMVQKWWDLYDQISTSNPTEPSLNDTSNVWDSIQFYHSNYGFPDLSESLPDTVPEISSSLHPTDFLWIKKPPLNPHQNTNNNLTSKQGLTLPEKQPNFNQNNNSELKPNNVYNLRNPEKARNIWNQIQNSSLSKKNQTNPNSSSYHYMDNHNYYPKHYQDPDNNSHIFDVQDYSFKSFSESSDYYSKHNPPSDRFSKNGAKNYIESHNVYHNNKIEKFTNKEHNNKIEKFTNQEHNKQITQSKNYNLHPNHDYNKIRENKAIHPKDDFSKSRLLNPSYEIYTKNKSAENKSRTPISKVKGLGIERSPNNLKRSPSGPYLKSYNSVEELVEFLSKLEGNNNFSKEFQNELNALYYKWHSKIVQQFTGVNLSNGESDYNLSPKDKSFKGTQIKSRLVENSVESNTLELKTSIDVKAKTGDDKEVDLSFTFKSVYDINGNIGQKSSNHSSSTSSEYSSDKPNYRLVLNPKETKTETPKADITESLSKLSIDNLSTKKIVQDEILDYSFPPIGSEVFQYKKTQLVVEPSKDMFKFGGLSENENGIAKPGSKEKFNKINSVIKPNDTESMVDLQKTRKPKHKPDISVITNFSNRADSTKYSNNERKKPGVLINSKSSNFKSTEKKMNSEQSDFMNYRIEWNMGELYNSKNG